MVRSHAPDRQAGRRQLDDRSQALEIRIERRMAQESNHGGCRFFRGLFHHYETVTRMAKGLPIVVCIPSEKRNFAQPMEKGNYLLVLHSLGARVHSDLLYGNPHDSRERRWSSNMFSSRRITG